LIETKKPSRGRLFCSVARDYFFSSAAGAAGAAASAFGASAAGASAAGASAFGASAAGASAAGAGAAASSFLPQAARARASREAISNDFFMIFLRLNIEITVQFCLITTGSYRTSGRVFRLGSEIDALPHHRNFLAGNYTGLLEKLASRFICFAWAQAKFRTGKL
jgi:hypothetical protein